MAPAICFLCGVGLAPAWIEPRLALAAAAGLLAGAVCARRRDRLSRGLLLAALILLGAWRERDDRERYAAARHALFGTARVAELELEGRVVRIPERGDGGDWFLLVHGRPHGWSQPRAVRVSLRVTAGSPGQAALLREIGTGDRVRVWCRLWWPRRFANRAPRERGDLLRARGLDAVGSVKSGALVERLERAEAGPGRWIDAAKRSARRRLDRAAGPEGDRRALLGAVLLGDRGRLSDSVLHRLRRAGLAHLVAISGLHLGVLVLFTLALLRRGRLAPWALLGVAVVLLPAFGIGVGARPSVVRAVLATLAVLVGRSLGREGDPLNTLALLAGAFVAVEPAIIADAGYQLTFLATAGILAGRRALGGLAISLAAYLATAPRVAWFFGRLAPAAVLTNLPALPLCGCLLVAGYGAILFHEVPLLGALCARASTLSVSAILFVAEVGGSFTLSAFRTAAPSPTGTAVYYGLLLACARYRPGSGGAAWRRARARLLAGGFALAAIWIHLGPPPRALAGWEAEVLDVGQGLSVLLAGPGTGLVLVDAAGSRSPRFDPGERIVLPEISWRGYRRVDALVLSHEHEDHAGGALAFLREIEVGEIWLGPGWQRSPLLEEIAAQGRRRGAALVLAERGLRREPAGIPLRVSAPRRRLRGLGANDRSLVVLAGERPCRLLLPGDIEAEGERVVLGTDGPLRAEAIVMPHHGGRDGSSRPLLARVRPVHAVASAGRENRFRHPHAETLRRFEGIGAVVWRTDLHGAVRLRATPSGWEVEGVLDAHDAKRDEHEREGEDQGQEGSH